MSETMVPNAIVLERRLAQPPARVWQVLTDTELLGRWLMPNDFAPVRGHRFTFHAPCAADWDGLIHCVVLEVAAPRLLRYSWVSGPGSRALDSTVTWTLEPAGAGTLLHLEHRGFRPGDEQVYGIVNNGWARKLDALAECAGS
jgi:uncharacterized protein YndB with AHSA1/START domain